MNRVARAALVLALVIGVAACSGGGQSTKPSKDQFITEATAICKAARQRIKAAADALDPDDPNVLPDYVQLVATEALDEMKALRELGFPEGDGRDLGQAVSAYERTFRQWQADPSAAARGSTAANLTEATKYLQDYGVPACSADI